MPGLSRSQRHNVSMVFHFFNLKRCPGFRTLRRSVGKANPPIFPAIFLIEGHSIRC
jgi:hypothetical protein